MTKALLLELISACNLRCKMCPFVNLMSGLSLKRDKISEIFRDINRLNAHTGLTPFSEVRFDGNTEPLLYKKLISVIQECKQLLPSIRLNIITNGVLLNSEISQNLLQNNVNAVHISVTGLTGDIYKEFQGYNFEMNVCEKNLDTVKNNINNLVQLKKKLGANTIIEARYIITEYSKNGFIPYLNYWHRQGVDQIYVSGLGNVALESQSKPRGKILSYKPCRRFGQIIVQASGNVILSCCDYIMESVGNIYEQSFFDIMTSDIVQKYEKAHAELDIGNLPKICVNCPDMHVYEEEKC